MKKGYFLCLTFAVTLTAVGSAFAETGAELYQSKGCVACHGANGISTIPTFPSLRNTGKTAEQLVERMNQIANGESANPVAVSMVPAIQSVADDGRQKIADWLTQ